MGQSTEDGATLLELVITVSIALALTVTGMTTFQGYQDTARQSVVEQAAQQVYHAAHMNIAENYRTSQERLNTIAAEYEKTTDGLKILAIGASSMQAVYVRATMDGYGIYAERGEHIEPVDSDPIPSPGTEREPEPSHSAVPTIAPSPEASPPTPVPTPSSTPEPSASAPSTPAPTPEPEPAPSDSVDSSNRITGTTRLLYEFDGAPRFWLSGIADDTVLALYDADDQEVFRVTGQQGLQQIEEELDDLHGRYEMEIDGTLQKIGGTNSNHGNGGGNGNGNGYNTGAPRSFVELYLIGNGVEEISYLGPNLRAVPDELPSTVTRLIGTFAHNDDFNDPSVAQWDVSNVQDMEKILQVAKSFDQDLSHWDVCNVTNYRPFAPGTPIGQGNSGKTPDFRSC